MTEEKGGEKKRKRNKTTKKTERERKKVNLIECTPLSDVNILIH